MSLRVKRLHIQIDRSMWDELGLDDPDILVRARSAMYIGYGFESLRRIVKLPPHHREVTEVLRVAPLLGLTDEDVLTRK